jgi:Domain of unknown function (DUF6249)
MKTTFLICLCSIALGLTALGQIPTPAPASPAAQPTSAATSVAASPAIAAVPATVAATPDDRDDSIEAEVARKLKRKFGITIDTSPGNTHVTRHHKDRDHDSIDIDDGDLGGIIAIPIIAIIFSTLFGAPVLVVAAIMFFSYLKSRSLHRTVREMVAKGQEVPAALFAPPPVMKARSDLRRGVVLLMVGFGLMIFFGAVNDWEGGAWSLGVIPFVIGLGYLLVWKLEGRRDKVPPLP